MLYLTKIYAHSISSKDWSRAPQRIFTHAHPYSYTKNTQMVLDFARIFFFCFCSFFSINTLICTYWNHFCVYTFMLSASMCDYVCGFHCHYIILLFSIFRAIHQDGTLENRKQKSIYYPQKKHEINKCNRTHFCCIAMYGELITYDLLKTEHYIRTRYMRLFCVYI